MPGDNSKVNMYRRYVDAGGPHITINIDAESPVEIGDFVSAFTAISDQYVKFIRENHPNLSDNANVYVREIRHGSFEADIIPDILNAGAALVPIVSNMEAVLIIEDFVRRYGARLASYFKLGGRDGKANQGDLRDFMGQIAAIANDPNGNSRIEAVNYEDGKKQIRAAIKFDTSQARMALREIESHRLELEHKGTADHQRVLMVFHQSNIKNTAVGKRTGERVVIEDISERELPLVYASDLAEQQIKHEIKEADDNVYKKGFMVDVNVATKGGSPVAYRVTNLHQVIDLPDEDGS